MGMKIIYEDPDILAVNKPAGLLVHRTPKKDAEETLADWIVKKYPDVAKVGDKPEERPGIVHRLDKDTSGVIVIAKSQRAFENLKDQFQSRLISKTYRAIVFGNPKQDTGTIEGMISLKPGTTKRTVHKGKMPKEAVTDYKVIERFENAALLEVYPKTGRTHQIRVHLASINHPIMGDQLYGSKSSKKVFIPKLDRQMLHAYKVELESLKGTKITLKADEPEDFLAVLQYLRKTPKLQ
ncbi:MAG: hypothetical protein A3C03_00415 [Candidatus Colwellbacteria bacterium RIFCSPHIGHO2_02_FULL_45_17]|nr:MAG: hypothetical protein A3C03_00415 [Candidatus Colwellbacteria bacterium RIFCSPHIGHO2_02_FULL_45_17]